MCNSKELVLQEDILNTMPLLPGDLHCLSLFLCRSSNKYWRHLYLDCCHIGDAGLRIFHQSVAPSGITIFLSFNSLTLQSADVITEIANFCKTKSINISDNRFTDGVNLSKNSSLESCSLVTKQ